ncbi:glycoside hydrolase family 3 C-terminal domain-containing protein [Halosquirtibacter laminarini]|uniref:Glycoside hydrolase family 3 C-terminal domain-containing protein n=1 Tax=Halosquirtibacter laminarini TaxID=3374600 RepID=A0AC61NNS2_9BACT|nr:glycoside hydrolase family 3 C-terminal domain-containing protein [Prolixibacteraceae bacterium]
MKNIILYFSIIGALFIMASCQSSNEEDRVASLLEKMTLEEKIGQMCLINTPGNNLSDKDIQRLRNGEIGSVLNETNVDLINQFQREAVEKSRLGIPLLIGRDVVHGFKTMFPIPLGMAASWNPNLVKQSAVVAAKEAKSSGINWTFAPMVDLARDARWGRIAESFGEDPLLSAKLGVAMIQGFQSDTLNGKYKIAACAKHFAGYGAAEGGRDYNTALIPMRELYDQYFPAFEEAVDAGVFSIMTSFNEIDGVPSTGNRFLLRDVLRDQWGFKGFVVSDWCSTTEMIVHGFAANPKEAAERSINAGVDMEMVATSFHDNIKTLLKEKKITMKEIDQAVLHILRVKESLNLFEDPYVDKNEQHQYAAPEDLLLAKKITSQSMVLLKNKNQILPLKLPSTKLALIGPLADKPYEQLGTWNFDGDVSLSITPRDAFTKRWGNKVSFTPGLNYSRDKSNDGFASAIANAKKADVVVFCAGEEAILSGEAHSRAGITLPGAQAALIKELKKTGKPIVLVIYAGRPLVLNDVEPYVDAIIYGWHPGTMGGEVLADIVDGTMNPSGKLPVTFPRSVGQIPMHYNHKNTGRPVDPKQWIPMDKIPIKAIQTSLGNTSHYLDDGYTPAYPFGYGLSYTNFDYGSIHLDKQVYDVSDTLRVTCDIRNTGDRDGTEIVQLYVRDLVGNVTRPVRELKAFKRVPLKSNQTKKVQFYLPVSTLAFHDMQMNRIVEPGRFQLWIGGDAIVKTSVYFQVK